MDLERVIHGEIEANPKHSDEIHKDAYQWLEKVVGFYPIFLGVGRGDNNVRMTGYQLNWRKEWNNYYRETGRFQNLVLLSFEDIEGVFIDYQWWNLVLNPSYRERRLTDHDMRLIFKPSWRKGKWLRKARVEPFGVQLVTPKLNLSDAGRIWVRNNKTKELLKRMSFRNVEIKRIAVR